MANGENPGYHNGICTCFQAFRIFLFLRKIYIPVFQNRYEDNCGVYWPFEPERNVPVECNSDESHTPGTFCVKVTRQGPRGFICKHFLPIFEDYRIKLYQKKVHHSIQVTCSWHQKTNSPILEFKALQNVFKIKNNA